MKWINREWSQGTWRRAQTTGSSLRWNETWYAHWWGPRIKRSKYESDEFNPFHCFLRRRVKAVEKYDWTDKHVVKKEPTTKVDHNETCFFSCGQKRNKLILCNSAETFVRTCSVDPFNKINNGSRSDTTKARNVCVALSKMKHSRRTDTETTQHRTILPVILWNLSTYFVGFVTQNTVPECWS